ncbi:MAG: gfo/Idh/MocA family oxidoreductase [Planctomycetota bacterium]|nr:MAG: gfo/Idh/MocA family oxidoreductase [Planctomycetota bacterium]
MPVRIGFLGTGLIAHQHMEILSRNPKAKMVAFCDINPEAARESAEKYGGNAYTDYRAMLDSEELDAVYVCIPPFAHEGQEIEIARRGIHLFVEKPVTLDTELGERVAEAIEENGVISSVGYHFRYLDTVDLVRGILRERRIGMALGYWMSRIWKAPWWKIREKSGGQAVEQTTHIFDLARYLLGEVKEVYATRMRGLVNDVPDFRNDDMSCVMLKFENGAIGCITSTCILDFKYKAELALVGRKIVIEISLDGVRIIEPDDKIAEHKPSVNPKRLENDIFIEAVESGDASAIRCTYEDGLRTAAVTLAANRSMESGEVVKL